MSRAEEIWVDGPVGKLEGRAHGPSSGAPVLLCHPLPAGGGTMGSRLVYDLSRALADAGWFAVRFNYRGVGRSEGQRGEGPGEAADAAAVFDWMVERTGRSPVVVGHSFGGGVAVRLATSRPVRALALMGVPPQVSHSVLHPAQEAPSLRCPVVVIAGDRDGFVTVEETRALAAAFRPPAELHILPGVGHFLYPQENPAGLAKVLDWLRRLPPD